MKYIYFTCKGEKCLQTSKDNRNIVEIESWEPRIFSVAKNRFGKSCESLWLDESVRVRNTNFFASPVGHKTIFSVRLKNGKKNGRRLFKVDTHQCHCELKTYLNQLINASGQAPSLQVGRVGKSFFPHQSLSAVKWED